MKSGFAFEDNCSGGQVCVEGHIFRPLGWSSTTTSTTTAVQNCDVFVSLFSSIARYNIPTNTIEILVSPSISGFPDIASTSDKLWVYTNSAQAFDEYDITFNPLSIAYNRSILTGVLNMGPGLCAVDNTHLIGTELGSSGQINLFDITNSPATRTVIGTLPTDYSITGDFLLTSTGKLLCLAGNFGQGATRRVFQYTYPSMVLEGSVVLTDLTQPWGLAEENGNIYIFNYNNSTGETDLYTIGTTSPYPVTLIQSYPAQITGAAQKAACCPLSLIF